jgi:16S rRNA (guanine(966)-N(2))-methyltransferase RsmD
LDLFSGTGNIAYEFFSRGAQHITCVDKEINCTRFINATAKTLKAENIKTFNENVFRFVESCKQTFDIIFADPPFDFKFYDELIEKILSKNILTPNGIFIVEHSSDLQIENEKFLAEQRKYGHVTFNFYTAAL